MPTTPARQRLLPESLIARTWIGADPGGCPIGFVLLAHPPARWPTDTFADVERKMRGFAAALGLRPSDQPVAELGGCVTVTTGPVILSLPRIRRKITLPAHARWQRLLITRPEVAVAVGLVPLGLDATAGQVDRYLDDALRTGRLLLGRAGVVDARRLPPCPVPTEGREAAPHPSAKGSTGDDRACHGRAARAARRSP